MKITVHGARGSIPVSGEEYKKYGGDTTCLYVEADSGDSLIIDAGSGIRRLGNFLMPSDQRKYSILFTHSHWDHILGFPYFKPIYLPDAHVDIFGLPSKKHLSISFVMAKVMSHPYFPVESTSLTATINYINLYMQPFQIGSVQVTPILLSHPNGGVGYKLEENGKSFVFLTDNEPVFDYGLGVGKDDYIRFCEGVDLLIHDSEYTEEEYRNRINWGHSCYKDAADIALKAGVKNYGLFHHNQDHPDHVVDEIVDLATQQIRRTDSQMNVFGARELQVIQL